MKPHHLAASVLLAGLFVSSPTRAGPGVNLSWDACTEEGGVQNKTFACDTNVGSRTMYGSFVLSANQPHFVGAEIIVDLQAQGSSLPAWWQFTYSGACRVDALTTTFDFGSDPGISCHDPWDGQATGGIGAYSSPAYTGADPNTARLTAVAAVPSTIPQTLTAGTEYYCFKVNISSVKTVGSGSCAGCAVPVCILLTQVRAVQSDNAHEDLTQPVSSNLVTWQSAQNCPAGLSPQNVTWGQIRSVLR